MNQHRLIFLLILLFGMDCLDTFAYDFEVDGIYYVYNNGSAGSSVSVSYRGSQSDNEYQGNVVIPESVTYNGQTYSVTSIGYDAFNGCSGLTSITIPSCVKSIGSSAFSGTNIKKVIWLTNTPPTGWSDAKGAVNYVANNQYGTGSDIIVYPFLSSLFEVDGIKYVPVSPSERTCDAIDCVYDETAENIKIPSAVTYKGIEMSVKNVQPYICYGNTFIKNLTCDNDGGIGQYAFYGCSNMEKAILGNVSNLDVTDFKGCYIGSNISEIGNFAFSGCQMLNNLVIADRRGELKLGSNGSSPLFADCPLDSVYIGGDITYDTESNYGYSPFYRNTSLRTVVITDKETEISDNEFYGCKNLQSFSVGDGVTRFGNWAFSGCLNLKDLAFGSHLAEIGQEAFSDCASVTKIVSRAATPPTCGSQALDDINKWECTLMVPEGKLADYQAADQWKEFFFAMESEDTSGPHGDEDTKCATPTIAYVDERLVFDCATDGVSYHYNIEAPRSGLGVGSRVPYANTITISVYATKTGYEDSDIVTQDIDLIGLPGDLNGDGVLTVADVTKLVKEIVEKDE